MEVWWRGRIGDTETVNAEFGPCAAGSDWTEVGAAVFLRAAHDSRGNLVGTSRP